MINIYPEGFSPLFWLLARPLLTLGFLAFSMIEPTFKRTAMQVSFQIFHNNKI
jgi:hypothetical protein